MNCTLWHATSTAGSLQVKHLQLVSLLFLKECPIEAQTQFTFGVNSLISKVCYTLITSVYKLTSKIAPRKTWVTEHNDCKRALNKWQTEIFPELELELIAVSRNEQAPQNNQPSVLYESCHYFVAKEMNHIWGVDLTSHLWTNILTI